MKKYFNSADARILIGTYDFAIFPIHGIQENGICTCNNENCTSPGKHPATPDGFKSASKNIEQVKKLWSGRKGLNVGIATGEKSGIFVVDVDSPEAEKEINKLINLPKTYTVKTGRGKHLYFKHDPSRPLKNGTNIIKGVDIRGNGGYVAGVGSIHKNGVTYEAINPLEVIEDAPDALYDILAREKPQLNPAPSRNLINTTGWTDAQIQEHLTYINPDCDYDTWIRVGMALHENNAAFYLWDEWSKRGAKYDGTTRDHWKSFNKGGGVTYGSIVALSQQGGWNRKESTASVKSHTLDTFASAEVVDPETGEVTERPKILAKAISDIDLDNIPPRAWLFGTMAARKYVTMIGASPGAGKSIFTMQAGVAASSNKPFGTHAPQEDDIKTWIYNNEEGEEELRRRLKGILLHNNISPADLKGKFFMNSGEDQSICIAKRDLESGGVVHTPDYDALKEEVISKKIDLLIIDPFAETHDLSENSNDELKRVAGLYRSIAIDCNCAVVLVHHTRKGSSNESQSSEHNSNMDNLRGAGSQLGVVRRVFTLAKMDEKTAKSMDISPDVRRWYVRLDDAKSNITAPADSAEWFKFKSLPIGNGSAFIGEGDHVGVLVHKTAEEITNEESAHTSEERVLLLTRLARVFIKKSVDNASVQKCAEMLLEDGYGKYKDRTLRKIIPDFVKAMSKNTPIVSEGYRCFFDILEGDTKRDGTKIYLHIKEISDF